MSLRLSDKLVQLVVKKRRSVELLSEVCYTRQRFMFEKSSHHGEEKERIFL